VPFVIPLLGPNIAPLVRHRSAPVRKREAPAWVLGQKVRALPSTEIRCGYPYCQSPPKRPAKQDEQHMDSPQRAGNHTGFSAHATYGFRQPIHSSAKSASCLVPMGAGEAWRRRPCVS
jgi:hypothetical protein